MTGKQILQLLMILAILVVLAWIAFYVLVIGLAVGAVCAAFVLVRRFLIEKGIVNAPAMAPDTTESAHMHVEIIDVDYNDVSPSPPEREAP